MVEVDRIKEPDPDSWTGSQYWISQFYRLLNCIYLSYTIIISLNNYLFPDKVTQGI